MANTVWNASDKTAGVTLSNLNLTATSSAASNGVRAVDRQIAGKFYFETTLTTASTVYGIGLVNPAAVLSTMYTTPLNAVVLYASGTIWVNNATSGVTLGSMGAGGFVVCLAVDIGARLFWARVGAAGNWNANAGNNPATGVGGISLAAICSTAIPLYPAAFFGVAAACTANFGDTAFTGVVPSGFTSGFTTGTPPLSMISTQIALEEWGRGTPAMQVTQVAIEEWASVATVLPVTSTIGAMVLA